MMGALAPFAELPIPDLYGAGDTVHEQGRAGLFLTIADQLEHLCALLDQIGWEASDLVGYSLGVCAMELARALPDRINNLVLIGAWFNGTCRLARDAKRRRLYTQATEPLKKPMIRGLALRPFWIWSSTPQPTSPGGESGDFAFGPSAIGAGICVRSNRAAC